ncbi:nucleoside-triphosphatase [Winogradskyella sp.]|uniref:nucleoside-triphosphatase n=1 Tax=Winogradskyella sp. TaxID=1883156 RepID=UPI003BACEE41
MTNTKIYILSDRIRSGKTTALQEWVKKTSNVVGFLSPDINGKRMFLEIETGKLLAMEKSDGDLTVGKYNFAKDSFDYVEQRIKKAWHLNKADVIVLDEIGPLEIKKNLGFHQLLLHLQNTTEKAHPNLILVVRDYCLEDFKSKYKFNNLKVLTITDLKNRSF